MKDEAKIMKTGIRKCERTKNIRRNDKGSQEEQRKKE